MNMSDAIIKPRMRSIYILYETDLQFIVSLFFVYIFIFE